MKVKAGLVVLGVLALAAPAEAARKSPVQVHLDDEATLTGNCNPATQVHFSGEITATKPEHIVYEWRRSDGQKTQETVDFDSPGTKPIGLDWSLDKNYAGWIQIFVVEPRRLMHVKTKKIPFKVECSS